MLPASWYQLPMLRTRLISGAALALAATGTRTLALHRGRLPVRLPTPSLLRTHSLLGLQPPRHRLPPLRSSRTLQQPQQPR
jgi:hypothetical protein